MIPPRAFGGLDYAVIAAYAVILLVIGYHFSRRQRTTEEYFTGGRSVRPFLAGISFFTATTSIITYIGNPGEFISYGPALTLYAPLVSLPFLYLAVGWLLIPSIMRLPITSAYELLEARLGLGVRQTGSLAFILTRMVWMALILYLVATILVRVVGCSPRLIYPIAAVTGAVTTTYTLFGGIRTVMITEVLQFFLLLAGAILTLISISVRLGGVGIWWPHVWEKHWEPQPFFSLDPHLRVSQVGAFLIYLISPFCVAGSDQAAIQRFLTTRDSRAARRAFLLNNLASATIAIVLLLVGAAVLGFFRLHPDAIPGALSLAKNGDAFFPLYISHYLPAGISGLLVACILASAMACLAAGINATLTVVMKDFIEVGGKAPARTEAAKLRLTRYLAIGIGLTVVLGSIVVGFIPSNLVEVAAKTVNLLTVPIFGLFFLAMFIKFATPFGAIMGAIYSTTAATLVAYWEIFTGSQRISFLWMMPVSLLVSLAGGCLFSLLPTRGRSAPAIAAWALAVFAPLALAVAGLIHWGRT